MTRRITADTIARRHRHLYRAPLMLDQAGADAAFDHEERNPDVDHARELYAAVVQEACEP